MLLKLVEICIFLVIVLVMFCLYVIDVYCYLIGFRNLSLFIDRCELCVEVVVLFLFFFVKMNIFLESKFLKY